MLHLLKRILSIPLAAALLTYDAADAVFGPIFRPAIAWLASLRLVQRLGAWIGSLPPYAVLVLLAVPFAAIEPFKIVGLLLIAKGAFVTGVATLVGSYLLSFFVCERIFHAGKAKLLTIGWFAYCYELMTRLRTQALDWLRSTAAWRAGAAFVASVRRRFRRAS